MDRFGRAADQPDGRGHARPVVDGIGGPVRDPDGHDDQLGREFLGAQAFRRPDFLVSFSPFSDYAKKLNFSLYHIEYLDINLEY